MDKFEKIQSSGGITEYRLRSNQLTTLLMEDHSAPVVTLMVTYLVGSRNEAVGHTGATHLLEHLMFKGSTNFNKENGNTIWNILQNAGARLNATTWLDRTNYFELLPVEHLEQAIAIEADRMRNALIRDSDRQPEMTVVRNEFERGENDPWDALDKSLWATAYQAHPYHHSTIGWRSDIENIPTARLKEFYDTFYWPNNAVVTLIGGFDTQLGLELVDKYFGAHTASPNPIPEMYTVEPPQEGPRRLIVKRSGETGIVGLAYKSPQGAHTDKYPLALLANILGVGKSSRLYRSLIDKGLATRAMVWEHAFRDPGLFMNYLFLTPDTSHEQGEAVLLQELESIKSDGVTDEELQRALGQIKSAIAFSRDGSFATAAALNEAIAMGDWTYFTTYLDRISKVTTADIQRVAQTYLVEDQSTTGWFVPKAHGGADAATEPAAAKLHAGGPYYLTGKQPASTLATGKPPVAGQLHEILTTVERGLPLPGIQLYTKSMAVADVVTMAGSFRAGDVYNPKKKCAIAQLTTAMLDKGTTARDKFEISDLLDSVGAKIAFSNDDFRVNFSVRCLKDDLDLVMELLAEQLRSPAFDEADLATMQTRFVANLQRVQESTDEMAKIRFSQLLYPENHPNYGIDIGDEIAAVKSITRDQLQEFYETHYGLGSMLIAAAGDINRSELESYLTARFEGWADGHKTAPESAWSPPLQPRHAAEFVPIAEKTSIDLILGCSIGIDREHADFIPLHVGNFILGGNFAARLMGTVRDEQGLTYSISSYLGGANDGKEGFWVTQGSYSPDLLDKGRSATMEQIEKWVEDGITEEELSAKQTTIIGTAQVGLANTGGMVNLILDLVERGLQPTYLSEYLDQVAALDVGAVNQVIRKYIDPAKLCEVAAGTLAD